MAGAEFVRADLHVHTHGDSDDDPNPDLAGYVAAAVASGIEILGITDHNTARFAREAVRAGRDAPLLILPGVEISTHDGHLLALFGPDDIGTLEELCGPENLGLKPLTPRGLRSTRSMLDLVEEIARRGGLAIPAHVDAADGIQDSLGAAELTELLANPALGGLEFATRDAMSSWFTDEDENEHRRAAWKARIANSELRERGLARLMSSDAHSVDKVGRDRGSRTLTRIRLDEPHFAAVRNAVQLNPKARCKAEAILPASYPRLLEAQFAGGFLDGVTMTFSPNLNCLIGGRGSGKSTALLAIRAALGARSNPEENPDEANRMPDETRVRFLDGTGSERTAVRLRGGNPVELGGQTPIRLRLADMGQEESGRLARGYEDEPQILLDFLDGFVVRHDYDEKDSDLLARLEENASDVRRTSGYAVKIKSLEEEQARLTASLKAAQKGNVEQIAQWASLLAAQSPLLERLAADLKRAKEPGIDPTPIDVDALADDFGVDLNKAPAKGLVEGEDGLRERLSQLGSDQTKIRKEARSALAQAAASSEELVAKWKEGQLELEERRRAKQKELEAQGLSVQAGAVTRIATRLNRVKSELNELRKKRADHRAARETRGTLLSALRANRDSLFEDRKATLKRIANAANRDSDGPAIRVYFERQGIADNWLRWLTAQFGFRSPRVNRLASRIDPAEFARQLLEDRPRLLALEDEGGAPFFSEEALKGINSWDHIFELQTMALHDRPRIEVQASGGDRKSFQHLSAGQQRSILLSLLLCAERSQPLILDQPEDHLDARYISTAVVRHLESAKERRQVIIATHSANLTVLGDAELVIPMEAESGLGRPRHVGAVDKPETRDEVCALLEGGAQAYRKRGARYGFRFQSGSPGD